MIGDIDPDTLELLTADTSMQYFIIDTDRLDLEQSRIHHNGTEYRIEDVSGRLELVEVTDQ